jgi:hypothetical protein
MYISTCIVKLTYKKIKVTYKLERREYCLIKALQVIVDVVSYFTTVGLSATASLHVIYTSGLVKSCHVRSYSVAYKEIQGRQ